LPVPLLVLIARRRCGLPVRLDRRTWSVYAADTKNRVNRRILLGSSTHRLVFRFLLLLPAVRWRRDKRRCGDWQTGGAAFIAFPSPAPCSRCCHKAAKNGRKRMFWC